MPRASHGEWAPSSDRRDPIALVDAQNVTRLPELVPVRWGRMLQSPFAFLRGAAVVMASDLAGTPATSASVQVCGDAHVANFGVFASPERDLLFDVNDFDETTVGPWEWDIKRLATSAVVAARQAGMGARDQWEVATSAARSYRTRTAQYAAMGVLEVWYSAIDADAVLRATGGDGRAPVQATMARARRQSSPSALPRLTELAPGGGRRIVDHPPLVSHEAVDEHDQTLHDLAHRYRASLEDERRALFDRFEVVDFALKVMGVGSVGTRCFIALLVSDLGDPLFLQIKEAQPSVVARYVAGGAAPRSRARRSEGRRVVSGQRLMQAASDIFLGWVTSQGVDYYVRQLRDMKGGVDTSTLGKAGAIEYAELCGWALARAHARSGLSAFVAGYAGTGESFDQAIGRFAMAYADQTERDHALLEAAVRVGRVPAVTGV